MIYFYILCFYFSMQVSELIDFMNRTINEGVYKTEKHFSNQEKIFIQMGKLGEEMWELYEQVLWNLWAQRSSKSDKFSQEYLWEEFADVIYATIRLACLMNIDINSVLNYKMKKIKERILSTQ